MGATEEQMELISDAGITHVSYVLVLYSFSFLIFLFTNMLLHLYATNATSPAVPPKDGEAPPPPRAPRMNGHAHTDSRQIRDAEEFELAGLMSDDEPESPSTLGKNSEGRVD
jgi:hypothetical protein